MTFTTKFTIELTDINRKKWIKLFAIYDLD